jgi:hypothetical protein
LCLVSRSASRFCTYVARFVYAMIERSFHDLFYARKNKDGLPSHDCELLARQSSVSLGASQDLIWTDFYGFQLTDSRGEKLEGLQPSNHGRWERFNQSETGVDSPLVCSVRIFRRSSVSEFKPFFKEMSRSTESVFGTWARVILSLLDYQITLLCLKKLWC